MSDKEKSPAYDEGFTNPFRYIPHPMVREAARRVVDDMESLPEDLLKGFSEGKMMGVIIVHVPSEISDFNDWLDKERRIGYLAGFSGAVNGISHIDGFVPPVFDLFAPEGQYRAREAEITGLNQRISSAENSLELSELHRNLELLEIERDEKIKVMKAHMAISKKERDAIRCELTDSTRMAELIRESQFEKAELRRMKNYWESRIGEIQAGIDAATEEIARLKTERAEMSDSLQRWIFEQYIVHNALGESSSVWELFTGQGLVPQGGTGDCAAPKLLNHAYKTGLIPMYMGEFWYGKDSVTAVRCHGHFYPSCTSKCGPLLEFMMRGLNKEQSHMNDGTEVPAPVIVFEDESLIIIEKSSGMPSVPGLDGRTSVLEWLDSEHSLMSDKKHYESVHRLDMDTSGIMVFAKKPAAAVCLRRQFEEHTVSKTYMARLCPATSDKQISICIDSDCEDNGSKLRTNCWSGKTGRIELPLSADYDERPRQKVDFAQGKSAITYYEVLDELPDGCTDILFHPVTGRTHQLRVHSSHSLGLGRPILGDLLYGGAEAGKRLHLHALSITFTHPESGEELTFTSSIHHFMA